MKTLHVLIADDHKMVRQGLRLLIDAQPDMHVVGEAANGREVLLKARELKPDVVVMDLSMPELNGLQATEQLQAQSPEIKVVAITANEDESYLRQLCKVGAAGYVLKRSAGDELVKAIGLVGKGGVYYEASVASKALVRQMGNSPTKSAGKVTTADLSDREREVLVLLAWGYSNKEIAAQLSLSVKTVETYKVRTGEKLGLRSRTEMVQYAVRQGWLNETNPFPPHG
jgi:DNA-binding NarL/FixJ family response regulator